MTKHVIAVEFQVIPVGGARRRQKMEITYGKPAEDWTAYDYGIIEKYLSRLKTVSIAGGATPQVNIIEAVTKRTE